MGSSCSMIDVGDNTTTILVSRQGSYSCATTDGCNQFDEYFTLPDEGGHQDRPDSLKPRHYCSDSSFSSSNNNSNNNLKPGIAVDVCSDAVVSFDTTLSTPLTPQKQRLLSPSVTFRDTVSVLLDLPPINLPQAILQVHEVGEAEAAASSTRTCGMSDVEQQCSARDMEQQSLSGRGSVVSPQSDGGCAAASTERPLTRSCVPHRLQQARQVSLLYMKRSM